MITTLVLIAIAILALAFFFGMLRGRAAAVPDVSDLRDQVRPVDLAAFRNLVDPDEESYLREHLPRGEFRAIRRERLRAGIDYVQCVVANAVLLLRVGEAARRSQDPEVAAAGQELVNSALRLRIYALLAQGKLYARILIPGLRISPARISDSYEHLAGMVSRLGRLQNVRQTYKIADGLRPVRLGSSSWQPRRGMLESLVSRQGVFVESRNPGKTVVFCALRLRQEFIAFHLHRNSDSGS